MTSNEAWGTDVEISLPVPPNEKVVRSAGAGRAFSRFGLVHDLTTSDVEGYLLPTFGPVAAPERE
jgi:hypothetical protein